MPNQNMTGYPSIDKPWLKFYSQEHLNTPLPEMSCYAYIKQRNTGNMDLTAITFFDRHWTYRQMFAEIDRAADGLVSLGVRPGEVVSMVLPVLPEEVFLFYAINKVGAISNFMLPSLPKEKICSIMQEHESRFLFIFPGFLEDARYILEHSGCKNIILTGMETAPQDHPGVLTWANWQAQAVAGAANHETAMLPGDTCFIAKTGGSTGESKSVMLNNNSFNNLVAQYTNTGYNYNVGDTWLRLWPVFSASAAVTSLHVPICFGMNSILLPIQDMTQLDQYVLLYEPNHLPMAPVCLEVLAASELLEGKDLSFLKVAGIGGCMITPELENLSAAFFQTHNADIALGFGYGMTENGSGTVGRMNKETSKPGSCGIPLSHNVVGIFDPDTYEEKKYYEQGEICIQSPSFMNGYWKQPELTKQVLRTHTDGSVWLHSGDLGYMDEEGFLFVKGRMKTVIFLYHTGKVYPSEMEDTVSAVDGVSSVVVVSEPDRDHPGYFRPACFIVPAPGADGEAVKAAVWADFEAKEIATKHPQSIYILDKIPLTPVGKPDLKLLEKMAAQNA